LYHALALADSGAEVDLVGYRETSVGRDVREHPRIRLHTLRPPAAGLAQRLPRPLFVAHGLVRFIRQAAELGWTLARLPHPDTLLVQDPPALPTLPVAWCAARLRRSRLVIDWHNFGETLLALQLGASHPVVRLAGAIERAFGRLADAHLCVSHAMHDALATAWAIPDARVLHDLPAARFAPLPPGERREARAWLLRELALPDLGSEPGIVVCPSSFTLDEDHDLLLEAARACEARWAREGSNLPPLLLLATGIGPRREAFERAARELCLERIHVRVLWLAPDDYPRALAAADLGLCLHRSASGVDLPMKLADFLGAGLPVCALDYGACLRERLAPGETGVLFSDATGLAERLEALFRGFPVHADALASLRSGVEAANGPRWRDAWEAVARPVLLGERSR
jgi:beta-1,4-mannosyltransferase